MKHRVIHIIIIHVFLVQYSSLFAASVFLVSLRLSHAPTG